VAATEAQPSVSKQPGDEEVNAKLVTANTRLSFKLFTELLKKQPNENIFISPASIAIALDMVYNGASGKNQQAIAKTLELQGMTLQEINQANAALKVTLSNPDPKVQISIANSLWAGEAQPFKPEFIEKIQHFYSAEVKNLNFGAPGASNIINDWVKQNTNGKIDKIVDEIGSDTVLVLLNAIYFKGNWKYPFPREATQQRPFTLLNGAQKQHPMMFRQVSNLQYYQNEMFQAISLPYGEGRLSMYIFLPFKGVSLKTFYESLNAENWQKWLNQFDSPDKSDHSGEILIGLPRFKLEYSIELNDALKALGMEIAFREGADFSAMTPSPLQIDLVQHKTFVEVNEEGTEAAAVTGVAMTRGIPDEMIVDRPFFLVIRDNQTGTILFMGSIVEPEDK
jgi:serpin B